MNARRSALLARYLGELDRADEEQAPAAEIIDAANNQWDVRVLAAMSEGDRAALAAVAAAIDRLDRGYYGLCATCGAQIAAARLAALPETATCVDCASFAERREPRWSPQAP